MHSARRGGESEGGAKHLLQPTTAAAGEGRAGEGREGGIHLGQVRAGGAKHLLQTINGNGCRSRGCREKTRGVHTRGCRRRGCRVTRTYQWSGLASCFWSAGLLPHPERSPPRGKGHCLPDAEKAVAWRHRHCRHRHHHRRAGAQ